MHEELVAWLRSWSELPAHCECYESCDECDKQDLCSTFTNESIITKAGEAADAIEEMSSYVRQIEELRKDGYYLQKSKMMTYGQAIMTMPLPQPPKEET